MKFDQATIALVPRTTSNCIDLGCQFVGQHLREILSLWFLVAVPACGLIYFLNRQYNADWRVALVLVHFGTVPLGAMVMAGAAPSAFGERFGFRQIRQTPAVQICTGLVGLCGFSVAAHMLGYVFREELGPSSAAIVGSDLFAWSLAATMLAGVCSAGFLTFSRLHWSLNGGVVAAILRKLSVRTIVGLGPALILFGDKWPLVVLGFGLCLFPGGWLAVRQGFVFEKFFLRTLDGQLEGRRTSKLVKELTGDFFMRGISILLFCSIVWFVLILTWEGVSWVMFGTSTFQGPVDELLASGQAWKGLESFLLVLKSHPTILMLGTGSALFVYTIGRLAWFFCYIDARVRRDCWDMELQIHQQSRLLQTVE